VDERENKAELQGNLIAAGGDVRAAIGRGDWTRADALFADMTRRDPRWATLPLLRLSLAIRRGGKPDPRDADELLEVALSRNTWLLERR
jgi:hypothetical protein